MEVKLTYKICNRFESEFKAVRYQAIDKLDALVKLVKNLNLYLHADSFEDPDDDFYIAETATIEAREEIAQRIIEEIEMSNGDGCDYIISMELNGEVIMGDGPFMEDVDW